MSWSGDDMDYHAIVYGLPGLFVILDAELTIVAVSDAYNQATMTRRDNMLGKSMFQVFPDNPGDPSADGIRNLLASLKRVLASRSSDSFGPPSDGCGGYDTCTSQPKPDASRRAQRPAQARRRDDGSGMRDRRSRIRDTVAP